MVDFKSLILLIFLFSFSFADYQKVKIGYIDSEYKSRLTHDQLFNIIKDIERNFENTLGVNVFDYHKSGKPIHIVFMAPSKKKLDIKYNIKTLKRKKKKIEEIQKYLVSKKEYIRSSNEKLNKLNNSLNDDIRVLNRYIQKVNNKNISSQSEYNKIKNYVSKKKQKINLKTDRFNQKKRKLEDFLSSYNQRVSTYNTLIKQFNRLQRKVEIMARSMTEIKGAAIGQKTTTFKTFYENGESYTEKTEKSYMEKIEIYGFKDLNELKVVLAHEIGHLVGLGHIEQEGALMNPILQKSQLQKLELTSWDMDEFVNSF